MQQFVSSVLVVSEKNKISDFLVSTLPSMDFTSVRTVTNISEAKRLLLEISFDIIIVNTPLSDDYGIDFAMDTADSRNVGVLIFVKEELYCAVSEKAEKIGVMTLTKPINRQLFSQSLRLVMATQNKLKIFEEKTISLQSKMEEIRLVNRAKLILVENMKMSEAEAHKYIEKRAMDACIKRRKIAEIIINNYENRGTI